MFHSLRSYFPVSAFSLPISSVALRLIWIYYHLWANAKQGSQDILSSVGWRLLMISCNRKGVSSQHKSDFKIVQRRYRDPEIIFKPLIPDFTLRSFPSIFKWFCPYFLLFFVFLFYFFTNCKKYMSVSRNLCLSNFRLPFPVPASHPWPLCDIFQIFLFTMDISESILPSLTA